jgi:hypothetical protein
MRSETSEVSSFDLFLDTICNTFGGVVFLAILMALLIQTHSVVKTDDNQGQAPPSPDEIREMISELDALSAAHAALSETLLNTPQPTRSDDNDAFRQLVKKSSELEADVAEITSQNADAAKSLAQLIAANAALDHENSQIPVQIKDAENGVAAGRAKHQALAESKQQNLRLPRERTTSSASALLMFQNGRVVLAFQPSVIGSGFVDANVTKSAATLNRIRITINPGAGWDFTDPGDRVEIAETIADAARNGNAITVAVWPDSYELFDDLRKQMIDSNVPYQLWPQDAGEELLLSFGSGVTRIQ